MADMDALKSRVERAERHVEAAREARESQTAALVEMWRQIRDRFASQEREIEDYRAQLLALEEEHVALLREVESLLAVVEGSVGRAADDTVPQIADMAQALLDGEDVPDLSAAPRRRAPAGPKPSRPAADADADEGGDLRAELAAIHQRLGIPRS